MPTEFKPQGDKPAIKPSHDGSIIWSTFAVFVVLLIGIHVATAPAQSSRPDESFMQVSAYPWP